MKKQTKRTVKKRIMLAWGLFFAALVITLISEKFIEIHAVAGIDGRMFFHAWFGFISCIIFILFSKILGLFIKRQESYYKENRHES